VSQYYVGEIILVGFNFAPSGFITCDGRLLPIAPYETLFNLIGTTYGGDGQSTFAVPDLSGRVPIHVGQGLGLTNRQLGEKDGSETVFLSLGSMPTHTHAIDAAALAARVHCQSNAGTARTPVGNVPAREAAGVTNAYSSLPPNTDMRAGTIAVTGAATIGISGSSLPHPNRQPVLGLRFCIAAEGIFPT